MLHLLAVVMRGFQLIYYFSTLKKDGKYVVLPSGELQIRNVSPEDGEKTYKCRTKHRLTGETKLSATAGKLVITGKHISIFYLPEKCHKCSLISLLCSMTMWQTA